VLAELPAWAVPVPPEIGRAERDHDEVADADADVVIAAGTEVHLARFERLHAADLYLGSSTHRRRSATTTKPEATNR
jgi:hypothetical protein